MEKAEPKSTIITTGLALFAMFFGAGNVVFPLALGQYAQGNHFFATLGMILTAVGVPFLGLISITLFNGNYQSFFGRLGKVPGFLFALFIMGLIGPFGAIPRCISLSYSTVSLYVPYLSLPLFSFLSCIVIFLFTFKKNKILDVLGYILTPLLLLSLLIIIVKGIISPTSELSYDTDRWETFLLGLKEGYQTMDLLGAFFFSSVMLSCLEAPSTTEHKNYKKVIFTALKASGLAAFLLALVYFGFSYVAALHNISLSVISKDQFLGILALNILGSNAGIIAIVAVALACLTTAIALCAVFAEFLHEDVTCKKISYIPSLLLTLLISFFVSTLSFSGIALFLVPILEVCYPALIVLSIVNLAFKLYHFQPVKVPVFLTLFLSLLFYFL